MKWYIVVEGKRTEAKIYPSWLAHAFPELERAARIEDVTDGRYYLIAGYGYPSYLDRIRNAIADIKRTHAFDHLVICVDAEEATTDQRRLMLDEIIAQAQCPVAHTVVVHDCCIETWLLGHETLCHRQPQSPRLRQYQDFYDVRTRDPEAMPAIHERMTRAGFHHEYLRELFRERNIAYSKRQPGHACDLPYLQALARRVDTSDHLRSLAFLLEHWRGFGAQI